ncbi:MAG TPA: M1 family metallopeptidase [Gemmatimonadales bacterium]|nr:M1 family metallopeptidase [Gemmatimonadales bacterium]
MSAAAVLSLLAALQSPLAATPDTGRRVHDALRYDISIAVSDTGGHIVGEVETTWRLGSSDPVVVPLDSAMRVVRVLVDGRENTRMYRTSYGRNEAIVYIPHGKGAGDSLKTRIRYHGTARDGLLVQVDSSGRRTFFADNWPDRAHRWLPVQDHPSDKAAVSFRVEVPADLKVIANGVLVKVDTLARDRVTWQYRLDEPVSPYNFVLGAAAMTVTPLGESACAVKCVPQSVWSFPEDSAYAAETFAVAPKIVEFFSTLVGPFPYPSLAHVQSSTTFGGMENATAIFYPTPSYRKRNLTANLIAHETAHQWFGDAVTERDWHHLWLSEGLATYLAELWTERSEGVPALQRSMSSSESHFVQRVRRGAGQGGIGDLDRPIIDTAATDLMGLLNGNNYGKAAWMLHQLRGLVGDSAFVRGLRDYYERHRHGTALSEDLQASMEKTSGQSLGWFFREAFTLPGLPVLDVRWTARGRVAEVEIEQMQPDAWGVRRIPKLELAFDGQVITVDVQERVTRMTTKPLARAPGQLVVDPNQKWLLDATVVAR